MALMNCSECGKEISNQAIARPNCGKPVKNVESIDDRKREEHSDVQRKIPQGMALIIVSPFIFAFGVYGLFSIPFGYTFFITQTLFALIIPACATYLGGALFHKAVYYHLSGIQIGKCPYCGNTADPRAKSSTYKCVHCKKISSKKENYLERID